MIVTWPSTRIGLIAAIIGGVGIGVVGAQVARGQSLTTAPAIATQDTASAPGAQPLPDEQARMRRGAMVRGELLDALEQSFANDGVWPERLPPAALSLRDGFRTAGDLSFRADTARLGEVVKQPLNGLKLVYVRPYKAVDAAAFGSVGRAGSDGAVTVVLFESFDENPTGVWVGYADGHLEFAASPADLKSCQDQRRFPRLSRADATTEPAPAGGRLTLRMLDPEGKPIAGAEVGTYVDFGDVRPRGSHPSFFNADQPAISDEKGEVKLAAAAAFDAKFADQPTVPIYIVQQKRDLVAQINLNRADFSGQQTREVRLFPACHVRGQLSGVGLMGTGKSLTWTNAIVFAPGQLRYYTLVCTSNHQGFDIRLPQGDYGMEAYGTDCDMVYRYFHVEAGQLELKLQLDLPPATIMRLSGHPAPELRDIKGWEHGSPVKLADLRGKVVLLDFWGYWCGPCVASMPALMKLHDKFKDKGLVIIAVHDDSADSIEDMDRKLETVRNAPWAGWGGRDLPFLIALDGGGPTRIKYSSATARGATTAAYGIHSFPTTLAIGRDGRVVGEVSVQSPDLQSQVQKLLDE